MTSGDWLPPEPLLTFETTDRYLVAYLLTHQDVWPILSPTGTVYKGRRIFKFTFPQSPEIDRLACDFQQNLWGIRDYVAKLDTVRDLIRSAEERLA